MKTYKPWGNSELSFNFSVTKGEIFSSYFSYWSPLISILK